ncbi:MAG: hypothetical protein JSV78_01870 [Phycisphaerales bacterium]|nr:MAG: hypothetical protein JSV78_01870 [Phycisphaerales bacterium]
MTALLVGSVLVVAGGLEYRCTAAIKVSGINEHNPLEEYRRSLLAYVVDQRRELGESALPAWAWGVQSLGEDTLELSIIASRRARGLARVEAVAQGFIRHVQSELAQLQQTPDLAEELLLEYVAQLRKRLAEAEQEVESAIQQMPADDPRTDRNAALARWRGLRADFADLRRQLAARGDQLRELQNVPEPTHGIVSAEERQKAIQRDPALIQDLEELKVQLAQLKFQMLTTWQESAAKLDSLRHEVQALRASTQPTGEDEQPQFVAGFTATVEEYAQALDHFAETWNQEFTAIQTVDCDPYSKEILDALGRLRTLVGDFFFKSSQLLASMRTHTQAINEGLSDNARHHVFYSKLVRGFRSPELLHHRLEFAACMVKPANNFRVDAALRSARGLRRRTQATLSEIEERLEAEARNKAQEEYTQRLAEAELAMEKTRNDAARMIEEIVNLQDELNLSSDLTEQFLKTVLQSEFATDLKELAEKDFKDGEQILQNLKSLRTDRVLQTKLQIVSCEASDIPINLPERLRFGGIAALITLVAVSLVQWWFARLR